MLLRLMFVLLIALNIAVAAWLLLGDTGTHAVDATDAGVPKLRLLAELPASASTVALAEATTTGGAGGLVTMPPGVTSAVPTRAGSSALAAAATSDKAFSAKAPAAAPAAAQSPATQPVAVPAAVAEAAGKPASPARPKPNAVQPPAPTPATAAADAPVSPRRSYRCLAVGPFASQVDLRAARTSMASRTVRSRQRQEQTSESHGWRVFLPAQSSREQALAQARRLEGKGIKDYFVVTAQGELQNSVALGLFHDPANARKRRDEVIAAGFPARMAERTETVPVWWLDVVVPEEGSADVRRSLRNPAVSARPTGCF
jgi:hypothetical protein